MISPATLLILTEQIGKLYPHENSVDSYVNPLVDWMTQEWQSLKKRIVDLMIGYARGKRINEALNEADVWFPSGNQNQIWQDIEGLMKSYRHAVDVKAKDLEQKAKIDANPPGLVDWTDVTPVRLALSKEGVEAVVKELQWQKDFVDDLTLDTKTRVSNLLSSRYGGLGEFRQGVERTFRVDRDNAIDAFKKQARGYGQRVIDGKMSADEFIEAMQSSIENHYKSLYRQGKGIQALQEWEEELILKQAQTQNQYLRNFGDYIRQKQALGKDLTPYITARAELYGERGKSLFEAGHVAQMPDDALLTWQMQPAEHCSTCPIYASNSPYTKATLPGYPGEGFHLTECGVRCHCMVVLSDLYVTQKDLGLDIGKGFMPIPETPIDIMSMMSATVGVMTEKPVAASEIRTELIKRQTGNINLIHYHESGLEEIEKNKTDILSKRLKLGGLEVQGQDVSELRRQLDKEYDILYNKEIDIRGKIRKLKGEIKDDVRKSFRINPDGYELKVDSLSSIKEEDRIMFNNVKVYIKDLTEYINKDIFEKIDPNIFPDKEVSVRIFIMKKGTRAHAGRLSLNLPRKSPQPMHECYHEMGHWIEDARPDIQIRLKDFLEERTKGEKVLSLHDVNADYAKTEKYKKDKFIDPYFGKIYDTKDYKSNKTEILSTFFTYLHKNPNALMLGDPELFDFVFDILRGL